MRRLQADIILCLCLIAGGLYAPAQAAAPPGGPQTIFTVPHVDGQILVKRVAGTPPAQVSLLLQPFGGIEIGSLTAAGITVYEIDSDDDLPAAINLLDASPVVEYAQPNYVYQIDATPNDPSFFQQWSKRNTGVNAPGGLGTANADLNLVNAWDLQSVAPGTTIAIIDDSFDTSHPDLAPNLSASGKCFASPNSARPCGNGPDDPNPANPGEFHGTLVAGAAAARGNNGFGIAGAVWEVQVLPLKIDLTEFAIVAAIDEAVAQGADIINASFGGPVQSSAIRDAIARSEVAGILFVASSGNADANNDFAAHYPSDTDSPNVLSVAATTANDFNADFSQWGPLSVDLAAPGELILTTASGGGLSTVSGTSFSAPHAAGVAALIRESTGATDYAQIKAWLLHGGIDGVTNLGPVTPGQDKRTVPGRVASGRLDSERALAGPGGGVVVVESFDIFDSATGNGNGVLDPGETAHLRVTLRNHWTAETGVFGTLSSPNTNDVSINTSTPVSFGTILQDGSATAEFSITASGAIAGNLPIFFSLELTSATNPSLAKRHFYMDVGRLVNGVALMQSIQRWNWDEFQAFTFDVPIGAASLNVATNGSGDIDLLMRRNQSPEYLITLDAGNKSGDGFYYVDSETRVSAGDTASESLSVTSPLPGTYHIVVVNYDQAAKSYEITATHDVPGAGEILFSSPDFSVSEGDGQARIDVERTGSLGSASVDYTTAAGSATNVSDYQDVAGTLSWDAGESGTKSFYVPIVDEDDTESAETVNLSLSNANGAALGTPSAATLSIVDNDSADGTIALSVAEQSVDEDMGTVTVNVQRQGGSDSASVDYRTRGGSASTGIDFLPSAGNLSWSAGESGVKSFSITLIDDGQEEPVEDFLIELANPTGATLGSPAAGRIQIVDDDVVTGSLAFSAPEAIVVEGDGQAQIAVRRIGGTAGAVSVDYATASGSASAGQDFVSQSGTLNWADGDGDDKTFLIGIVDDNIFENEEVLSVRLANPTGTVLGAPTVLQLHIADDDTQSPSSQTSSTGGGGGGISPLVLLLVLLGRRRFRRIEDRLFLVHDRE